MRFKWENTGKNSVKKISKSYQNTELTNLYLPIILIIIPLKYPVTSPGKKNPSRAEQLTFNMFRSLGDLVKIRF